MISILVPTKGRPIEYNRMIKSISDTSSLARVFTGISETDQSVYGIKGNLITPEWMPTSHKWELLANKAYRETDSKLFMLGADDTIFATKDWDKALFSHYEGLTNKIHVYSLCDSRDKAGTPHPIVTREYVEAMGYFLPPLFLHWFVDSWTVEIAKANNCFTYFDDLLLIHDKPTDKMEDKWGGDATRNDIRKAGWLSRDMYVNKSCKHFLEAEKNRLEKYIARNTAYKTNGSPQNFIEATQ